jgi:hypothetical protein
VLDQKLHEIQQEVGKGLRGGKGNKGDFEGFVI